MGALVYFVRPGPFCKRLLQDRLTMNGEMGQHPLSPLSGLHQKFGIAAHFALRGIQHKQP
jgi:hypothetical protein